VLGKEEGQKYLWLLRQNLCVLSTRVFLVILNRIGFLNGFFALSISSGQN
jgi:hypothetical protein